MYLIYALTALTIVLSLVIKHRRKWAPLRQRFVTPPGNFLLGHIPSFINPNKVIKLAEGYHKNYGKNVIVYIFFRPYLMIMEPKLMEAILGSTKTIDKSDEYKFFKSWLGLGLLTSTGVKWKSHRKILTPSFHYKILEQFIELFDSGSRTLVKNLKKNVGKEAFDVFNPVSLYTLDVICETAMGVKVNAQEDPKSPFVRSVRDMCDVLYKRCFSINRLDFIYWFTPLYKEEKRIGKIMSDYCANVIRNRRALLNEKSNKAEVDEFGAKHKHAFLDVLLQSSINGKPISDEDILDEVNTFMFEGNDTTSIAISFTLYSLSKNQHVQKKAYEELKTIFGDDKERAATYDDLQNMKYLDMVIKESLRMYPPVPVIGRMLTEDFMYDGTILPKGLSLAFFPYQTHHDPDFYPDPNHFDPERFSQENVVGRHPYAFVPFSAGPRNCIGQKFAMLELRSAISKVLRNYHILEAPGYEVQPTIKITLESMNEIKICLAERIV